MSALRVRRERTLLAATLGIDPKDLPALAGVEPEALQALRSALDEHQFNRHRRTFRRIGKLAGSVPAALASRVAQVALGPVVAARAAATMEPALAVKLSGALPTAFLADLSVQLDPQRARAIIAGLPSTTIFEVAELLVKRREHLTLSRFISVIDTATAVKIVDDIDARALLEVANLAEDDGAVDAVLRHVPDTRAAELAATIADDDAALDLLALVVRVADDSRARLLDAVLASDEAVAQLAKAIAAHDLAADVAPVLTSEARARLGV